MLIKKVAKMLVKNCLSIELSLNFVKCAVKILKAKDGIKEFARNVKAI